MELNYTGKLYIQVNGEPVIGPGRIELLEQIIALGSIRKAAKAMNMSYRQAWQYIDQMNTALGRPIVTAARGGKGGGNTIVTADGLEVIRQFRDFHAKFKDFLSKHKMVLQDI